MKTLPMSIQPVFELHCGLAWSRFGRCIQSLAGLLIILLLLISSSQLQARALSVPAKYTVAAEVLSKYPELVQLIERTGSMDDKEKQQWLDILPGMTDNQIDRLFNILETERRQLEELDVRYQQEIKYLNAKHVNIARSNPTLPTLRIETGGHVGGILALDVDESGQFALTAGRDKTARIWKLPVGELHQTLRLPLADGHEGMLFAAALHPSMPWAVVGGQTTLGDDTGEAVAYVFHRDSGALITRLKRLTSDDSSVVQIHFLNGGNHLLIRAGKHLSIWRTSDWTKVTAFEFEVDKVLPISKNSNEYWVIRRDNEQVTKYAIVNDTPTILKAVPRSSFPKGDMGWAVSPDQRQALWAENDQPKVWLVDLASMKIIREAFSVNQPGVEGVPGVAWRRDGRIFLSYRHPDNGQAPVLATTLGAKASVVIKLREPAYRMALLPNDDVIAATTEPLLAILPAKKVEWRVVSSRKSTYQDAEAAPESILKASEDGRIVEFGFDFHRSDPHVFNLGRRDLSVGSSSSLKLPLRPDTPGVLLQLKGWKNWEKPSLQVDGRWKELGGIASSASASIEPNQKSFVVGTTWSVTRFDSNGNRVWLSEDTATSSEVFVTNNSRLVISSSGEGIIKWRNYETGKVLLSFFPHIDGKRWVLWTPSGYYDASPGGEDLIGWHLNRGQDKAADFFAANQFRERFFRPDIIDRVLDTLDEEEAIIQANKAAGRSEVAVSVDTILPPVLELISAPERFADLTIPVRVRVRAPKDAPSIRLRVLVNGEIMATPKKAAPVGPDGSTELTLALQPKDSEVQIYSDNRHGTSLPLQINLKWAGDQKVFADGMQGSRKDEKPKLWILAVGVSSYKDPSIQGLNFAHRDADGFTSILKAQKDKGYREVNSRVLTNENATRASVLAGLDWLKANVAEGDVGVVFLSGHGFTMATDRRYYYGASDVDLNRLTETGVPYKAIQDALIEFNLRGGGTRAVFFIDTCHAGDATGARVNSSVKASNGEALAIELTRQENQVLVFASSKGEQVSWEDPKFGHGAFTQALIEGLGEEWRADPYKLGHVTYKGLDAWISARIPVLTQKKQTPRLMAPPGGVDDFPFASK
jgi:WD40 repeat protein